MQFSSIVSSLFVAATTVAAVATPQRESLNARAIKDVQTTAANQLAKMEDDGCEIFACMTGYAATIGICAVALIEPTPAGEIACIAAIIQQGGNPPASCDGCL